MKKENNNPTITSNSKQLEILKTNFPNCFDKNGDFMPHKMQEIIVANKDGINLSKESYSLNWLGKSYARLLANENPLTLLKQDTKHNQKQKNKNSENLLIKGDNLEVLKHLRHAYSEQVKMIYIDPPYNTGNDGFVYNDNRKFTPEQLMPLAGIDEDEAKRILDFTASNSNSHSAWLTFIYPRLYIARELLSDDGVIFISIDDNEQAQLKMLCDEVFGEENFIEEFVWHKKNSAKGIPPINMVVNIHEYVLCYSKNDIVKLVGEIRTTETFSNPDNDERGVWRKSNIKSTLEKAESKFIIIDPNTGNQFNNYWSFSKDTLKKMITEGRILFPKDKTGLPKQKEFFNEFSNSYMPIMSHLGTFHSQSSSEKDIDKMMGVKSFLYRKPVELMKKIIAQGGSDKKNIILDFFAGSGTTADAVMQLNAEDGGNRKYILAQLPEVIDPKKNKTAYDFVKDELNIATPTIFDITKERIIRSAKKIQKDNKASKEPKDLSKQDFGFKVFETLPMFDGYFNAIDKLVDKEQSQLFDGSQLLNEDLSALLSTWMVNDGIKLICKVEVIGLDEYKAHYVNKNLYLMDKGFTIDDLKVLIAKLDSVEGEDKDFQPNKLVLFGYNFVSKPQREISEALNSYINKKQIELDIVVRY